MGLFNTRGPQRGRELLTLTYRSRAVDPMSTEQLRELERGAQVRNRAAGLTGRAIYDDGRFFQWLEGPADSLSRVWESVRRDRRHVDIEGVTIASTPARVFGGWDMSLSIRGARAPETRLRPMLALVAALDPLLTEVDAGPAAQFGSTPGAVPVVPMVRVLSEGIVIPELVERYGAVRRFLPSTSPAAARLSKLLLEPDPAPVSAMLRRLHVRAGSLATLCATVLEPAARGLGDLWLADGCSELAVTVGLCRLQSAIRRLTADAAPRTIGLPAVLVAPQPGEVHLAGALLDAELLWQAGFDTHQAFPATDDALLATLSETWLDVLDLSLSPAMRREDALARMAETIVRARARSRNPALTVIVSGREFFENLDACAAVGADASTASALHVVLTVKSALRATLAKTAQLSLLVTSS